MPPAAWHDNRRIHKRHIRNEPAGYTVWSERTERRRLQREHHFTHLHSHELIGVRIAVPYELVIEDDCSGCLCGQSRAPASL